MTSPEPPWTPAHVSPHLAVHPSPPRRSAATLVVGLVLSIGGLAAAPICALLVLLTANPCGMFGDHCADYGKTDPTAELFLLAFFVSVGFLLVGVVLVVVDAVARARDRRRPAPHPHL